MKKCKNCSGYEFCKPFVDPDESFPEMGGCDAYRNKKLVPIRKMIFCIKRLVRKRKGGEGNV